MLNLEITEKEAAMAVDIFSLIADSQEIRNAMGAIFFTNTKYQFGFKAQDILDFRNKVAALNHNAPAKEDNK